MDIKVRLDTKEHLDIDMEELQEIVEEVLLDIKMLNVLHFTIKESMYVQQVDITTIAYIVALQFHPLVAGYTAKAIASFIA